MFDHQVLAFTGIAALLTVTPGADTMLVIRNVLRGGRRAGAVTTLGICCGLFVHAALSALGLSIVLTQSATAFSVLRWAGALYLIWLGLQSIRDAIRRSPAEPIGSRNSRSRRLPAVPGFWRAASRNSFVEGMANNVLNPKVAIFYLAFLPQFIGPDDPVLAKSILLAIIHFTQGIVWLLTIALLIDRARAVLASPRVARALESISGLVLISFGARLALESRR